MANLKNVFSAKTILLFVIAVLDSSIFTDSASLNQNWGDGFNAKPAAAAPQPSFGSQNVHKQPSPDRLNIFDTELLRHAARQNAGNFMISPASVKAALAMLLEGARGSCADELKRILKLPNDQNQVRQHFNAFMASLNTRSDGIILESANNIFLSDRFTPDNKYVEILKTLYYSDLHQANFSNPVTPIYINQLISNYTHGLIPELFGDGDISPDTIMILTNVLYFKGLWENAFNTKLTKAKCFNVDNVCRNVAMMEIKSDFKHGIIDELQSEAIEIPYRGGKYSMVILLPNEANGLSTLLTELPYFPLPKILDKMEEKEVDLSLPKFKIDFSQDLINILQQVGIQEVFNSNADLFGIISRGIKSPQVNSVIHKTHIEVNEQGSTAAAVTGAMVVPLMGSLTEKMNINHPFLFFIRDVRTGTILFQGRVNHPTEVYAPPPPPPTSRPVKQSIPSQSQINFPQVSQQAQQSNFARQPTQQKSAENERVNFLLTTQTNFYRQPVVAQQSSDIQRQRVQNERYQPSISNVRTDDYNSRNQPNYDTFVSNVGQQRQTNTNNSPQFGGNFQPQYSQIGKQQTTGSNTQISSSQPQSNSNHVNSQHDISRHPSNSIQIPAYALQSPAILDTFTNINTYNPPHDGNNVRDNKVSNNVLILQKKRPGDNIESDNSYSIQTPPNRMDVFQTTLSKDGDAIVFKM